MGKPYLRVTAPAFLRDKKKKEVSITDERSGTRMEGNALNEKQKTKNHFVNAEHLPIIQ